MVRRPKTNFKGIRGTREEGYFGTKAVDGVQEKAEGRTPLEVARRLNQNRAKARDHDLQGSALHPCLQETL